MQHWLCFSAFIIFFTQLFTLYVACILILWNPSQILPTWKQDVWPVSKRWIENFLLHWPIGYFSHRYLESNKTITRHRRDESRKLKEQLTAVQARLDKYVRPACSFCPFLVGPLGGDGLQVSTYLCPWSAHCYNKVKEYLRSAWTWHEPEAQ